MGHTITRVLTLDAGHRVPDHQSKCRSLHGHTYRVQCTFGSDVLATEGAANGMVADFGCVKTVMEQEIHAPCDHKMILYYKDPMVEVMRAAGLGKLAMKNMTTPVKKGLDLTGVDNTQLHIVNFIPTAENLAEYWFYRIRKRLLGTPGFSAGVGFQIESILVWETPNCYAEFSPTTTGEWAAAADPARARFSVTGGTVENAEPEPHIAQSNNCQCPVCVGTRGSQAGRL